MESLFDIWKTKIPKYNEDFRKPLFDLLSNTGGGAVQTRVSLGKHFSNNYELYMYAFFIGLYSGKKVPIPSDKAKVHFNHAIQNWGSIGNRYDRVDFTALQEYMFAALIAKTETDLLIQLEKGEVEPEEVVKQLITDMEGFTNSGLILIQDWIQNMGRAVLPETFFLNKLLGAKPQTSEELKAVVEVED